MGIEKIAKNAFENLVCKTALKKVAPQATALCYADDAAKAAKKVYDGGKELADIAQEIKDKKVNLDSVGGYCRQYPEDEEICGPLKQ